MSKRTLEDFSASVLAEWIRQEHPFFLKPEPVIAELERIEARQEWKRLHNKTGELIEEMAKYHGIANIKKYLAIDARIEEMQAKMDALSKIAWRSESEAQ